MMCYRDKSYCSDQDQCEQLKGKCNFVLSPSEGNRADILGLPIAWMSFKGTCVDYKELK